MLNPLPDREQFEREIRELLSDGDITDSARYLQMDRTSVSRMLNPDVPERHNPFWLSTALLWTFDARNDGVADKALAIVHRHRSLWLPAPVVRADPGKTTSNIGIQLMELIEKEMDGMPDEVLLKEAIDIRTAVEAKINEILARRGI